MHELSRPAELLLIRLLLTKAKPPTDATLRKDLAKAGVDTSSDERYNALLAELRSAALLTDESKPRLSDAGRTRALAVLGLDSLPPGTTWTKLRDAYQQGGAARMLGQAKLPSAKGKLAALMLKRRFALDVPDSASLAVVATAVVCKELGFEGLTDFKQLQAAVLSRMLRDPQPLPEKSAVEQFIRDQFGARRGTAAELKQALISEWMGSGGGATKRAADQSHSEPLRSPAAAHEQQLPAPTPRASAAFDLPAFAEAVQRAAASSSTGWFGDNKVFIAHAFRQYAADPQVVKMDLATFKTHLLEANQMRLLTLSRADLVAAMDPGDVRESETHYLNAQFHFILMQPKKGEAA